MERLYQMHVVPDALPEIRPSIDLHVIARTTPAVFLESKKVQSHVIPGTFLRPKQVIMLHTCGLFQLICFRKTIVPPKLRVNVFHTDVRLYTMVVVDLGLYLLLHFASLPSLPSLDVPHPESQRYTTFLHWMK